VQTTTGYGAKAHFQPKNLKSALFGGPSKGIYDLRLEKLDWWGNPSTSLRAGRHPTDSCILCSVVFRPVTSGAG